MRQGLVSRTLISMAAAALLGAFGVPATLADDDDKNKEAERLDEARVVFQELRTMKDAEIPQPLLEKAKCIVVFPGVTKAALGVGGRHGKGVMSCRGADGKWSAPIFLTLTGGSFGLQIGVEKADVVLFFMNDKGARSLIKSKFTIGGKGSVAAGPIGRTAEASTDIKLNAEIYSYAKTKGLFAGLSLEGARMAPDKDATDRFYGRATAPGAVLFAHRAPTMPAAAQSFVAALP